MESDSATPETLARYLTDSGQFRKGPPGRVTERAFLPATDGSTSVFRIEGLTTGEVWELARREITDVSGRQVHGAAAIEPAAVEQVGLSLERDDHPERHAAITGWPPGKEAKKSLAQLLAASATLHLRDP